MIHILCGDGKGKTTSAIGMAVRAAGRGINVAFVQLLKGIDTGEIHILSEIEGIDIIRNNSVNSFDYKNIPNIDKIHNEMLKDIDTAHYDMVILDEAAAAYNCGYVDKALMNNFISEFPKNKELVLTGRDPDENWIKAADYVSEIKKIKHPYDKGIKAREGIEL